MLVVQPSTGCAREPPFLQGSLTHRASVNLPNLACSNVGELVRGLIYA